MPQRARFAFDANQDIYGDDDYSQVDPAERTQRYVYRTVDPADRVAEAQAWLERMQPRERVNTPGSAASPVLTQPRPVLTQAKLAAKRVNTSRVHTSTRVNTSKRDTKPKDDAVHILLRNVPRAVRDGLKASSDAHGVSLPAYVVQLLTDHVAELE